MLKTILASLLFVGSLAAQTLSLGLSGPTGSVLPGAKASVVFALTSGTAPKPSALQWSFSYDPAVVASATWTSTVADKTLVCNEPTRGTGTCLLFGMNLTTLADGPLATVDLIIKPTTTAPSVTLTSASPIASSSGGMAIPISTSASPALLAISPGPCDINADKKIDGVDLLAIANQILGIVPRTPAGDLNKDSKYDLWDAFLVIDAGVNGICNAK